MSSQGLANLFCNFLEIDSVEVYESILPIWTLTWIIRSWANGLEGKTKDEFLQLRISDLMETADRYLNRPFVKELPREKNFELASGTVLFAHKS
jgi:hypothetical protein